MKGADEFPQEMPPPAKASLPVMMQFSMVGEEELPLPIRTPPPFSDVKPLVIVNPSRVELLPVAKVTTLPLLSPSITVNSAPFSEIRVMVLLGGKTIFS